MTKLFKHQIWHQLFEAGVIFKALNSVWELLGGIFLLTRLRNIITFIIIYVSRSQLLGEPTDFIPRAANTGLQHLTNDSTRIFVGLYLLFHGIMNAFLAYNLFRKRLWAYPTMILFVSLFFFYQLYRLTQTHSLILLAITIFDIFFIMLTWREWKYQTKKRWSV
jgi:uncharacterized membrane protein